MRRRDQDAFQDCEIFAPPANNRGIGDSGDSPWRSFSRGAGAESQGAVRRKEPYNKIRAVSAHKKATYASRSKYFFQTSSRPIPALGPAGPAAAPGGGRAAGVGEQAEDAHRRQPRRQVHRSRHGQRDIQVKKILCWRLDCLAAIAETVAASCPN